MAKRLAGLREKAEERRLLEKISALKKRHSSPEGQGVLSLSEAGLPPGLAERLAAHLRSFWEVPELLKDRPDLSAKVELVVGADGHLLSWRFIKSSGNRLFDEAVIASLKKADPLPAPGRPIKLSAVFRIEE